MRALIADLLKKDPNIFEAKNSLIKAIQKYQKKIKQIAPPNPKLTKTYEETLRSFAQYRGEDLWHPYLGSGFGNGPLVELADGSVKYDLICGMGPHYWGHNHPDVLSSLIDAALSDLVIQGNLQQNLDSVKLTELLIKSSGMDHCFLSTSGAMACENGLKIIFQKKYPAQRLLAFENCFTGRTLAISQITDRASYRDGLPPSLRVDYLPFFDTHDPKNSSRKTLEKLEVFLKRYPKQHAAMIFELVQGEAGLYPGTSAFFIPIMEVLKKNNIAVFVDEVQTFGRTPELFAYQHFKLESYVDLVALGKVAQVCATLYKNDFNPRPGLISQTFTSSTSAIRVGLCIIQNLLSKNYFGSNGKISIIHQRMTQHLEKLTQIYPSILSGPFGMGSMFAFTVFKGDEEKTRKFVKKLFEEGIIAFTAGFSPTRVRFLLPIGSISIQDLDIIAKILKSTLDKMKNS